MWEDGSVCGGSGGGEREMGGVSPTLGLFLTLPDGNMHVQRGEGV